MIPISAEALVDADTDLIAEIQQRRLQAYLEREYATMAAVVSESAARATYGVYR